MRFVFVALIALFLFTSCNYDMPPGIHIKPFKGKYPIAQCQKELLSSSEMNASQVVDRIRVYKANHVMELIKNGNVLYRFPVSLGKNPQGHKLVKGDSKTPVGHYKIVRKICDPRYYRSFLISYPDAEDIARAKKNGVNAGSGISIHSQPIWNADGHGDRHTLKKDWTNGCIAITTGAMKILWASLRNNTPIDIHP